MDEGIAMGLCKGKTVYWAGGADGDCNGKA